MLIVVVDEKSCLHYLLPPARIVHNHRLRHQTKFQPPKTRTARFIKSFVVYTLNNYQNSDWF